MTTINKAIATMFNLKGVKVKVKSFCTSQRSLENHNCVPFIGKVGKIVGIREGFEDNCGKFEVKFAGTERTLFFYGDLLKIKDETITYRKENLKVLEEIAEKPVDEGIKVGDYVRGTTTNRYGLTNRNAIMEVKQVNGNLIDAQIVAVTAAGHKTATVFTDLKIEQFAKITEADKAEFNFEVPVKVAVEEEDKIEVGDIVTGLDRNGYVITTKHAVMEVEVVYSSSLRVKVLEHSLPEWECKVGTSYIVDTKGFKKFKRGVDFSPLTK